MRMKYAALFGKLLIVAMVLLSATQGLAQSDTDLTAHFIEVLAVGDGISYTVNIYLSALDGEKKPILDLTKDYFAIQEDGLGVETQNLRPTTEADPLNVVLVMDTSSKMTETDIKEAKDVANDFVAGLKPNDQVAFVVFDSTARYQVDQFTTDRAKVYEKIQLLSATRDAGACIFDALDSAVNLFASQPVGNRAVILLTKSYKDQSATGPVCSEHKADDVIGKASRGELRTPIYVYSIDFDLDVKDEEEQKKLQTIQNFALQTGGFYENLASSSKLANAFGALSTHLRSEYILTYTSISKPGTHNLLVSLNTPGLAPPPLDVDVREFSLFPLRPSITFTAPLDGETITDSLNIAVLLTTQGEMVVERVAFEVNGVKEGEDNTTPYGLELDAKKYPVGHMVISATAYGANNTELARTAINLTRTEAGETPVVAITEQEASNSAAETPLPAPSTSNNNSMGFMAIALGGLSIVAIGAVIFLLVRQQKQSVIQELDNYVDNNDDTMPPMQGIPVYRKAEEDRRAGGLEPESDALGALTIEASDDSSLIGHRFEITASLITLGRSADNDINFPNDKPVSRHHAEIYQISGKLYLREVEMADATGAAKPPKYGTFINQEPMGKDPALLKTGDEIQLGKRVRLKFESFSHAMDADALTYDDDDPASAEDMDKTSEQD